MQDRYAEWADRDAVDQRIPSVGYDDLDYDDGADQYLLRDVPFTGFCAARYPDGKLESLTEFTDGGDHGRGAMWYRNGQIHRYVETARSVYHGWVAEWDQDGKLLKLGLYESGLLVAGERPSAAS